MTEMTLVEQVCSEEPARRLKELGVEQNGLYCWQRKWYSMDSEIGESKHAIDNHFIASAFTAAELGKILPTIISCDYEASHMLHIQKCPDSIDYWAVEYRQTRSSVPSMTFEDISEANARANMFIWLIENKKVKV